MTSLSLSGFVDVLLVPVIGYFFFLFTACQFSEELLSIPTHCYMVEGGFTQKSYVYSYLPWLLSTCDLMLCLLCYDDH